VIKKFASVFFPILFLFFCFFALSAKPAAAFLCLIQQSNSFNTTTNPIVFTIDSGGNLSDGDYFVSIGPACLGDGTPPCGSNSTVFNPVDGNISVTLNQALGANNYSVGVYLKSAPSTSLCQSASIVVNNETSGGNCSVNFANPNSDFTPTNDIKFYVSGFTEQKNHHYVLWLGDPRKKDVPPPATAIKEGVESTYNLSNSANPINLGAYPSGKYYLDIRDGSNLGGLFENTACFSTFNIGASGGGPIPGQSGSGGSPVQPIPTPPCATPASGASNGCAGVATGLGGIGTNVPSFVKSLFGILLSLAGAIAVLLIIISGYRLMASQGNPEKAQQAKEQLTAAIVGLLFIIFSLVILETIGFDILGIPGFTI